MAEASGSGSGFMFQVERLNSQNYGTWSKRIMMFLKKMKVWEAVVAASDNGYAGEYDTWSNAKKTKNDDALAYIVQYVGDCYVNDVTKCVRAKDAWERLRKVHCEKSYLQFMNILEQLCNVQKRPEEPMVEYLARVEDLCEKMGQQGQDMDDQTIAGFMLKGLSQDRYTAIANIMELNEEHMTTENIKSKLLLEESREKRDKKKVQEDELRGLVVRNNRRAAENPGFKPSSGGESRACLICNQIGHIARDCYRARDARAKGTVICYTCKKEGHSSNMCNQAKDNGARAGHHKEGGSSARGNYKSREVKVNNAGVETSSEEFKNLSVGCVRVKYRACVTNDLSSNKGDESGNPNRWLIDCGCNAHITPYRELLEDFRETVTGEVEGARKGDICKVRGIGSVTMKLKDEYGGWTVKLSEVLWVPEFGDNLMSVFKLEQAGIRMDINDGVFRGLDKTDGDNEIFRGRLVQGNMYCVDCEWYELRKPGAEEAERGPGGENRHVDEVSAMKAVSRDVWHKRFGHANNIPDHEVIPKGCPSNCEVCFEAKAQKKPFPKREGKSENVLDLIYSDVCFVKPDTKAGGKMFVTFTDDHSRYSEVEILQSKTEVPDALIRFINRSENRLERRVKAVQTDNGTEYVNARLKEFFKEKGIEHRLSIAGEHAQMGVAERLNQQLMTIARCMLIQSGLPPTFWGEAIKTSCFIKNRCKASSLDGQIPVEIWSGKSLTKKDLNKMRVFGCQGYVCVENPKSEKMKSRGVECVLLGYCPNREGYVMWDLNDKRIRYSRNVDFVENVFPMRVAKTTVVDQSLPRASQAEGVVFVREDHEVQGNDMLAENAEALNEAANVDNDFLAAEDAAQSDDDLEIVHENLIAGDENGNREPGEEAVRRSERLRQRERGHNGCRENCVACREAKADYFFEPSSVAEALSSSNKNEWVKAMEEEMSNHKKNGTWMLVKRPEGVKVMGCKWVLKAKRDQSGKVVRFKARLVAQGYNQVEGVDFSDSFSPVVKRKVVRLMSAIAVEKGWHCRHVDVKSAYLNSEIKEELYINQPEGFVDSEHPEFVCRLQKSMYGLKQAGKDWYDCLVKILKNMGLRQCDADRCLFYDERKRFYVTCYVDDLGIWGERLAIDRFVEQLSKRVEIRDLGTISDFLSVRFSWDDANQLTIDQRAYIEKVLVENGMENCRGIGSILPLLTVKTNDPKLSESGPCNKAKYQSVVGSLRYLTNITRPDIAFGVCKLSQKHENPTEEDWKNAKHLLRYVQQTKDLSLCFEKTGNPVTVYVDASWANDDVKSVTGYVILLGGGAVIWKSIIQRRLALSNNEAELMAMVEVVRELKWLELLLKEIGQSDFLKKPCVVFADNKASIEIALGDGTSDRTKHCAVEACYLQQCVREGFVKFCYTSTQNNVADILTKILSGSLTQKFVPELGLLKL